MIVVSLKVISNSNISLCFRYHSVITQNGALKDGLVACELHLFCGKISGSLGRNTASCNRFVFADVQQLEDKKMQWIKFKTNFYFCQSFVYLMEKENCFFSRNAVNQPDTSESLSE